MKKKLIVLLLILCVVLICAGIYGLARNRHSAANGKAVTPIASTQNIKNGKDVQSDALLTVIIPKSVKSQIKDYEGFRVSFNESNHTPNWVAWELLASETDGGESRSNKFWQDMELEGCPTTRDYSNSGYDRGHLCPAADQKWSDQAMSDCFSLANIAPQDHALNTGAWKTLENKERVWAKRDSAIIIVAGPVYTDEDRQRIGEAGVRVPGAFFKVMIAPFADNPRGIAFVYPNMSAPGNMENYVMTIRDVENLTGYDFFSALPDELEDLVESTASFRDWNRKR